MSVRLRKMDLDQQKREAAQKKERLSDKELTSHQTAQQEKLQPK
jgi:hypothetical protein